MFCIVCGSWTCHVFSSQSFSLQEEGEMKIEKVHLLQCSNHIDEPRLFSISESIVLVFFSFNRTSNTTHYLRFWWILLVFALTRLTAEAELIHWCYTTTLRIMSRAAASACSASRSRCCASVRTRWPDIYISTWHLVIYNCAARWRLVSRGTWCTGGAASAGTSSLTSTNTSSGESAESSRYFILLLALLQYGNYYKEIILPGRAAPTAEPPLRITIHLSASSWQSSSSPSVW